VTAVEFHQDISDPIFGISLRNEVGHTVFVTTTEWQGLATGTFAAGEAIEVRTTVDAYFAPSMYKLTPSVARPGSGANALDLREDLMSFYVHASTITGGLVDLPHTITIDRV
jgi:Wzt C-terminal domain